MLLDTWSLSASGLALFLTGLVFLVGSYVSPTVDELEPPQLKPRVPLVGHIISMIREGASFYVRLFNDGRLPICTLPMLNGKLYIINAPDLIQSALRNNDISFDPFLVEFTKAMWAVSKSAVDLLNDESNLKMGLNIIHSTLLGDPLHRLNAVALTKIMVNLNDIQDKTAVAVPDVFIWLRNIMTDATATALFGDNNPLTMEHTHLLWTYDKNATLVALDVAPNLIVGESIKARGELNKLLLSYYEAKHDQGPSVSDLIRKRAAFLRSAGFTNEDLSHMELLLPWVGSTNTIPTLFWLFTNILTEPEYLSRVQAEIDAITVIVETLEGRKATFDIKQLERDCPFLNACYQETLRLYLHNVGNRRVMKDTKIQDIDGREYLLKKGINVQWPPMVTQLVNTIWGEDAATFKPERWLHVSPQEEKNRRGAMLPFGGGRHLCPGRKFALAEILGFVGVVALSFEVEGLRLPRSVDPSFGAAARRPDWGSEEPGMSMKRRRGWEHVTWIFED
ncbi:hypothetical protein F66182_8185 [Fusarium sp. NRRL 66182]|nr:hypothetical protein F66182_8185 [Fusarium sp. NRRL 66182]